VTSAEKSDLQDDAITRRWHHLKDIFHEISSAPEEERRALLEFRCDGDLDLRKKVEALLEASANESSLIEAHKPSRKISSDLLDDDSFDSSVGLRMGAYQIEKLLGRGGMGAVYLAHRADGEFTQKVAVKIIGLPFEIDVLRERFRQERQILAGLNHSNITRLLDGGVTSDGQLYLVMEYVDGVPIDQAPGDINTKLDRFHEVCEAVKYAHQNLVVHRDLKPSNILVDSEGRAKLLDFGSAKLLADAEVTQTGFNMITLSYASPEQLRGEPATTLSDVYSLGAILYQLITGEKPFGEDLVSRLRDEESGGIPLPKPVSGDLDLIIRKALALAPTMRYSSVEQFAEDVRRFRSGEPVMAHAPSFRYQAGKFARRNKLALGAGLLLLITLLSGIVATRWQYRNALAERKKAEARAEDLRKLSDRLLSEIDEAIRKLPGSTGAQQLLVSTVLEHLDRTTKDSDDPQLLLDAANGYIRLGNVQGNVFAEHTGNTQGALASLDKAVSITSALTQRQPQNAAVKRAYAWALQSRSEVLFGIGRTQEGVPAMREAITLFDDLATSPGAGIDALLDSAGAHTSLGNELGVPYWPSLSDFTGASTEYLKARKTYQRALALSPDDVRVLQALANNHRMVGVMQMQTDPANALPELRAAIDGFNSLHDQAKQVMAIRRMQSGAIGPYAGALIEIGRYREAIAALQQGEIISRELLAADPKNIRAVQDLEAGLSRESECYQDRAAGVFPADGTNHMSDAASALKVLSEQRSVLEQILSVEPHNGNWESKLGMVLIDVARQQRALHLEAGSLDMAKTGLAMLKEVADRPDAQAYQLFDAANGFITVEPQSLREPNLAVKYAERIVEESSHHNPEFLLTLAEAYRADNQLPKARAAARAGLDLLPPETSVMVMSRIRKRLLTQLN
jgi:tetratricopeptide (TPR) repeat protein/predicted Ser/Thr protein kinase